MHFLHLSRHIFHATGCYNANIRTQVAANRNVMFTSTQPLLFNYRYGGTIYAFLFSSDIVNNLMVAALSKEIKERFGYLGLFLIISAWGILALGATCLFPRNPSPKLFLQQNKFKGVKSESSGSSNDVVGRKYRKSVDC